MVTFQCNTITASTNCTNSKYVTAIFNYNIASSRMYSYVVPLSPKIKRHVPNLLPLIIVCGLCSRTSPQITNISWTLGGRSISSEYVRYVGKPDNPHIYIIQIVLTFLIAIYMFRQRSFWEQEYHGLHHKRIKNQECIPTYQDMKEIWQ